VPGRAHRVNIFSVAELNNTTLPLAEENIVGRHPSSAV
jgi:hypothetical protein